MDSNSLFYHLHWIMQQSKMNIVAKIELKNKRNNTITIILRSVCLSVCIEYYWENTHSQKIAAILCECMCVLPFLFISLSFIRTLLRLNECFPVFFSFVISHLFMSLFTCVMWFDHKCKYCAIDFFFTFCSYFIVVHLSLRANRISYYVLFSTHFWNRGCQFELCYFVSTIVVLVFFHILDLKSFTIKYKIVTIEFFRC